MSEGRLREMHPYVGHDVEVPLAVDIEEAVAKVQIQVVGVESVCPVCDVKVIIGGLHVDAVVFQQVAVRVEHDEAGVRFGIHAVPLVREFAIGGVCRGAGLVGMEGAEEIVGRMAVLFIHADIDAAVFDDHAPIFQRALSVRRFHPQHNPQCVYLCQEVSEGVLIQIGEYFLPVPFGGIPCHPEDVGVAYAVHHGGDDVVVLVVAVLVAELSFP